jgi:hypothetical protein
VTTVTPAPIGVQTPRRNTPESRLAGIWIEVARLRAAIQVLQHLFVAAPSEQAIVRERQWIQEIGLQLPDVLREQRGEIDTVIHPIDPAQTFGDTPPRLTIVGGP